MLRRSSKSRTDRPFSLDFNDPTLSTPDAVPFSPNSDPVAINPSLLSTTPNPEVEDASIGQQLSTLSLTTDPLGEVKASEGNPFDDNHDLPANEDPIVTTVLDEGSINKSLPTAPVSESEEEHILKPIDWWNMQNGEPRKVRIVTQNKNGPCPLIALANVLILRGDLEILPADRGSVNNDHLVLLLADRLVEILSTYENQQSEDPRVVVSTSNHQESITRAISVLPKLKNGLDVDLNFSSPRKFAENPELSVFEAFNVELVHGWCVDPDEKEVWRVIVSTCEGTYDNVTNLIAKGDWQVEASLEKEYEAQQTVHDALVAQQFLELSATQLTHYGLRLLIDSLPPAGLCVFFRNNHFNALFKHPINDMLYLLVSDVGYVRRPDVVWESLLDIDGSLSEFLDADFQPISYAKSSQKGKNVEQQQQQQQSTSASQNNSHIDQDFALALHLQQEEEDAEKKYQEKKQQKILEQQKKNPPIELQQSPPPVHVGGGGRVQFYRRTEEDKKKDCLIQ